MKLIFGDQKSIDYRDKITSDIKRKEEAWRRSGLSREAFEIKEELRYWGVN